MASHDVPIGATQVSLAALNERSREIFRQIVESYLTTGEPVGSRNLSRILPIAAVAGLGAQRDVGPRAARPDLCAAHLGRPAADRARPALLRRCADGGRRSRPKATAARSRRRSPAPAAASRWKSILTEASQMLSGLTRAAGVVLTAKTNVRLKHIEFVRLEPERALAVLVARGRPGREPRAQRAGRPADLGADRGRQLPQRAHPRQARWPSCATRSRTRVKQGQAELDQLTQKIIAAGLRQLVGRRRARSAS